MYCTWPLLLQPMTPHASNWTSSPTYTYNVTLADMKRLNELGIWVKNSDGFDLDSNFAGDLRHYFGRLNVSDGRLPASFRGVRAEYADNNTVIADPFNTALVVGTRVRIVATGTDPKGLPLEFRFELGRRCGPTSIKQEWSPSNVFLHTLAPEDVTRCTSVHVYVRNSDGWGHYDTTTLADDWVSAGVGCWGRRVGNWHVPHAADTPNCILGGKV
jgi:hypothetical protein